ncbi:hypothetical protein Droror1_Dr00014335 [Drosera rotundifolia]
MNAYKSAAAGYSVPLPPPQPNSMEASPCTSAIGATALPAGYPSLWATPMTSVPLPETVNCHVGIQIKRHDEPKPCCYMVDCYLARNKFCETRYLFRQEASFALANLILDVAPEDLMTLEAILNEYIQLKRQKEMMDQQRHRLVQERNKIDALLQGMQQAMNAYNSGTAVCCVPLVPPRPSSMEISPSSMEISPATYANGMSALPAGYPSLWATPITSVPLPETVNKEPAYFSAPAASCLPPRKRSRNITEETRAIKKPRNPLPSHQSSDKDLRVVSTSTTLTNVQMKVHQSSQQNNHMCVGSLTLMSSATTTQDTTYPGAASSQSNQCTSTPDEATPQDDDAPLISADIPSMTYNGEPSTDTSCTPTLQNVDNEGRNASEHEHVGFCDSALPSVSCLLFNKSTSTFDEPTPQEAEPTSSFVFSSMTNNGQLDFNGSALPTKQTVKVLGCYFSDSWEPFWDTSDIF